MAAGRISWHARLLSILGFLLLLVVAFEGLDRLSTTRMPQGGMGLLLRKSAPPAPVDTPEALPDNPFDALCEANCDAGPYDAVPAPRVDDVCDGPWCSRWVHVGFSPDSFRVQLPDKVLFEPALLPVWMGDLVFQITSATGRVHRCTWTLEASDQKVRITQAPRSAGRGAPPVVEVVGAHARRLDCPAIAPSGTWGIHVVDSAATSQLDLHLEQAKNALPPAKFADTRYVADWIHLHGLPLRGRTLVRANPRSRAATGKAAIVHSQPNFAVDGWTCLEQGKCLKGGTGFTDGWNTHTRTTLAGPAEDSWCKAWKARPGQTYAVRSRLTLNLLGVFQGPCDPSFDYTGRVHPQALNAPARALPFVADPDLPERVEQPWMLPDLPQPSARDLPPDLPRTVPAIARYLSAVETDPFLRVKAIHDWIALNIRYDVEALQNQVYGTQQAAEVFEQRKGVCAGYANLFVAMASAAGFEARYVGGHTRRENPEGHAWNAVRIEGTWYLLDATWNAGHVSGGSFEANYRTRYLFTPPEVFAVDHHPRDPLWQLHAPPLDAATFVERPILSGDAGLMLLTPLRARSEPTGVLPVRLANPRRAPVDVIWRDTATQATAPCGPTSREPMPTLSCAFPKPGDYVVEVSSEGEHLGLLDVVITR